MESKIQSKLLCFLEEEIGIAPTEVATAQRLLRRLNQQQPDQSSNLLPIVLWQYGLMTLEQLDRVLDWQDKTYLLMN